MLLEANLRMSCLVLTNNIHLCRLVQITEVEARETMARLGKEEGAKPEEVLAEPEPDVALPEEPSEEPLVSLPCPEEWLNRDCVDSGGSCPKIADCDLVQVGGPLKAIGATDGGGNNDEFSGEGNDDDRPRPAGLACPAGWEDDCENDDGVQCPKFYECLKSFQEPPKEEMTSQNAEPITNPDEQGG
jgi:hypothetical protein